MSFSSEIKEEISKLNTWKNKELVMQELKGFLLTNNASFLSKKTKYATENEYTINRFGKLLSNLEIDYGIEMQGNLYVITFKQERIGMEKEKDYFRLPPKTEWEEEAKKALVRGAFLGGGSITNPNRTYHLEIVFSCEENASLIKELLKPYGISAKLLERKNAYSIYLKDGEDISNLLAFIGASGPVLKFEEIRVLKEMKNNVNRLVNCETANLNKTVNTAVRQMEAIKKIKAKGKMKDLPDSLQEIAKLRIENPDASLIELGKMLKEPIGKSGVNHRLKRIEEFAEGLK